MPSAPRGLTLLVLTALFAGFLTGCKKTAVKYTHYELKSPEILKEAASVFWRRHGMPNLRAHDFKQLAIVDFTVEFAERAMEPPPREHSRPDEKEETPEERRQRLSAMREKKIVWDEGFPQRLTDELYAMMVSELEKRTREIVPTETIRSSSAYQKIQTYAGPETVTLDYAAQEDPDAAYVTKVLVFPADGLGIAKGVTQETKEEVAIQLIQEIGADVAARTRFRLGVFRGRATIERGSQVWVLSRHMYGTMEMMRSLVSDQSVLVEDEFRIVRDNIYRVNSEKYLAVMRALFPTLIALGFESGP